MEHNEVSRHEVAVVGVLRSAASWLTNEQIATLASVAGRTARAYTKRLVELGLLDVAEVFPGHRYRWSAKAAQRNKAYLLRIDKAASVFQDM